MTNKEFSEKYCLLCGSQRCAGIEDEPFRDGCEHYQREILHQKPMSEIIRETTRDFDCKLIVNVMEMCEAYYEPKTYEHCLRVARNAINNVCLERDEKQTAYIIGLCHDLLEDTAVIVEEIADVTDLNVDFLNDVLGALTKNKSETYVDYIKRLKDSKNKYSYIVKLADMKDHLSQKDTLTDRLKEKYWNALPELL